MQGVSGTVDDRALQLARVRRNRNEVGGAAYHRHQAVSRCLIRPAPPSQLPPVLRAANENRTFEPLEGWSRLWGLDDMQMTVHHQRATVVRTSGPHNSARGAGVSLFLMRLYVAENAWPESSF